MFCPWDLYCLLQMPFEISCTFWFECFARQSLLFLFLVVEISNNIASSFLATCNYCFLLCCYFIIKMLRKRKAYVTDDKEQRLLR